MSNETARLARKWVKKTNPKGDRETLAAIQHILATTSPLTMADVEWDTEEHHLAGATTPMSRDVVMMWDDEDNDCIFTEKGRVLRKALTPNGKKYELREVGAPEQPALPATLETVEDYVNAPEGTTVAEPGYTAWTKVYDGNWWRGDEDNTSHWMAGTKRDVLRRGWGK